MTTITANQAYNIATNVLNDREKDEQELQDAFSYIKERAALGAFMANIPICLSQNNINILKNLGFIVSNTPLMTNISWHRGQGIYQLV